jgi:multidrug resistance efflux pump
VLCVLFGLAAGVLAVRGGRPADAGKVPEGNKPTSLVTDQTAASGDVVLEAKGYIIPAHQVQVSPKIAGMLVWINEKFAEGQRFDEGELLARLEDVDYKADVDRADATLKRAAANCKAAEQRRDEILNGFRPEEVEQAKAELDENEAMLRKFKLDLQRTARLSGTQAAAQKEFEEAQSSYDATERKGVRLRLGYILMRDGARIERRQAMIAEADLAKAEVKQAEADLTKAKWRLDNCEIRAPVTGVILTKKAEKGNIVNPVAFNVSASLCDMADLSDLEVDLPIQERDISNVTEGQRCIIMPEAFQKNKAFLEKHPEGYKGYVSRLMPIADRAKGAIPVRVKLDKGEIPTQEQGVYLKPDMGVIVSFKMWEK